MPQPYSLQATFYRTALLLGIVRGDEVHRWAEQIIAPDGQPPMALIEAAVLEAVLGRLHADLVAGRRGLPDTVAIIRQLRSMVRVPSGLYAELNDALVGQSAHPEDAAFLRWLERFAGASVGS